MNKLYDRIYWYNNTTPALNQTNLNAMSKAIDDIDNRVIDLAADIMVAVPEIQEDIEILEGLLDVQEDSEAWAKGTRGGTPVSSSDPAYHNNSKYYAESAATDATNAHEDAATASQAAIDADASADAAAEIKSEIQTMVGAVEFTINYATGELEYTNDSTYNFTINTTTGNLEWEVVA